MFDRECTKWRKKDADDRTWEEFKAHFEEAENDRKKNCEETTGDDGYANATQKMVEQAVQQ